MIKHVEINLTNPLQFLLPLLLVIEVLQLPLMVTAVKTFAVESEVEVESSIQLDIPAVTSFRYGAKFPLARILRPTAA